MARSIASDVRSVLNRLQTRQIADMENLVAARSPQQLTCLRGFLGAGALVQRSLLSSTCLQTNKGQERLQLSTLATHQPSKESSTQVQQRRSVTTSPRSEQHLMYSDSSAESSPPRLMAKTLDLLRSKDHLQHLGDASAVHVELMRTLELAQEFYRQSRFPSAQRTISVEQLPALPIVHKDEQHGVSLVAPAEYEGLAAQLPQQAVEAGIMLDATSEERRQSLFDMVFDDAEVSEGDSRPDRWEPAAGPVHGRHGRVTPSQLSQPALAALAALVPGTQESPAAQSEQTSSTPSAIPHSSSKQERADFTSGGSTQSRSVHSRAFPAQAPAVGDRLELECSSIAFGGQGVCKLPSGYTVFCERALPGERLTARVIAAKKSFAMAHKLGVLRQHSDAVEAPCVHFQEGCGGCTMQNLAYASQLRAKEQQVVEALRRIGKQEGAERLVRPAIPCEQPLHYRNKMTFSLTSQLGPGGLSTGYGFKKVWDASSTLPISNCHLQNDTANQILRCLTTAAQSPSSSASMPSLSIRGKDGVMGQPLVKRLTVRSGLHPDSAAPAHLAILHVGPSVPVPAKADDGRGRSAGSDSSAMQATMQSVAQMLMREVPDLAGVVQHRELNTAGRRVNQVHTLAGSSKLQQQLCGLKFQLSPLAFFQTNSKQAEVMYNVVAEAAGLSRDGAPHLLDLYCGTGTIALSLASRCKSVTGVESVTSAVADARVNAGENGIKHARFLMRDLAQSSALGKLGVEPDVVVADPPRAGLDAPVIEYLKSCSASTFVYVSCDPATQARDLHKLCDERNGWPFELQYIQPVDMFPQTHHVEMVALLIRR